MPAVKKSNPKTSNLPSGETTRMQELGSAWIFRRALKDNKRYSSVEDIIKDPKFPELVALYPALDPKKKDPTGKVWLKNYYAQNKVMLEKFSGSNFSEFTREGGFMDYITELVRKKFGIAKKDTWDPADIWCIQNESSVISIIEKKIEKSKATSLGELNALLRTMYKKQQVVGISLKLVSHEEAKFEEVNVDDMSFTDAINNNFSVTSMACSLSTKASTKVAKKRGAKETPQTFSTQDSKVVVDALENGSSNKYKFQIKANTPSGFSNLKWEPSMSGASKARIGKAPIAMVLTLLSEYNIKFSNSSSSYPTTLDEFNAKSYQSKFREMFNKLRTKNVEVGVPSVKDAIENFQKVFNAEPFTANSKLMQMTFLYEICSLTDEERDDIMTDMIFLAQKKGSQFGPFGKIY